jgi:hypothetical protein
VRFGSFEQQSFQLAELRVTQQRLTAGAAGFSQSGSAVFAVTLHPAADALLGGLHPTRRLGLAQSFFHDQPHRLDAPLL